MLRRVLRNRLGRFLILLVSIGMTFRGTEENTLEKGNKEGMAGSDFSQASNKKLMEGKEVRLMIYQKVAVDGR